MISSVPTSIFVYGTLMNPSVLRVLLGRVPKGHSPAFLSDYQRYPVIGQVYPGMIASENGQTQGVLILDDSLSSQELDALDFFEGGEYTRKGVTVECNGNIQQAQTYVWSSPLSCLELDKEWDYQYFCDERLPWYLDTTVRPCRQEMDKLGIGL